MASKGKTKRVQKKQDTREEDVCEIDGDGNAERANWDSESHAIFVKLCVEEKQSGNMPTTHFTTQGWENICMLFNQQTMKSYTRGKLKNHWDNMRKEYQAWIFLKQKTSGLGWDPQKKTHSASKAWWDEMAKVNKLVLKFKNKGLEHEDEYEELFSRATATGLNAWTPSQGLEHEDDAYVPQPLHQTSDYNDIVTEEQIREDDEDDNCEEIGSPQNDSLADEDSPIADMTPTTRSVKRKKKATNEEHSYGSVCKGKRLTSADKITASFDRMVHHMERRAEATLSILNGGRVKEALKILNQVPGVTIGSPLFHLACRLFAKPYNRDLFIHFEDNEQRLSWLKEMELREPPLYPPQQFAQFPGGSSHLLAQPPSGFSLQFGQPSSGFSQQVAQPLTGFSQFTSGVSQLTTRPLGGFTQLLHLVVTSGVFVNQFSAPSNALSPHSPPDV